MSAGPLSGLAVVVTRSRAQAAELADLLTAQGAEVLEFPTIRTVDPDDWRPADDAIGRLASYDWIVFTSANGVRAFVARLAHHGIGPEGLRDALLAAVGPATAATLAKHGIDAAFVPDEHRAEGVIDGFARRGVGAGSRVLVPRALEAREVLPETLRAQGAVVDVVPVYRTVRGEGAPDVLERLRSGTVDILTFTSASTARNFVSLAEGIERATALEGVLIASIGPVTSEALRSLGMEAGVESADSTVPGLVRAIADHIGERRR
ncbi:MAG TPA: uroporphyrinogen-III synthase [Coriobacteriia bacterium]